jgi:hypothetical protein
VLGLNNSLTTLNKIQLLLISFKSAIMYQFGFEKLEVWQDARKLTVEVYK